MILKIKYIKICCTVKMFLNKFVVNILHVVYNCHKMIISDKMTFDEIMLEKHYINNTNNTNNTDILVKVKNYYKFLFYFTSNIYYKLILNDLADNLYIESLINSQSVDMTELRTKTSCVINTHSELYSGIIKWIAGYCWLNSLITNGYYNMLNDVEKEIIESVSKAVNLVEPISKPLVLYHGFETFTNYNEDKFKLGYKFKFEGILSKSSFFEIAKKFAHVQNPLRPKYLIVLYPVGSKHIGLDIRPEKYDEFEYIGKPGESFEIIRICKRFNGLRLETFYICKSLDY